MAQPSRSEFTPEVSDVSQEPTPLEAILTYVAPAPCIGFMFFLVSMYLMKFSTDVLLVAPGVMGMIFGISRIWDGISDPLVGYLSDRTHTRIGRRRPWLLASLVPIVVVFLMMWSPPQTLTGNVLLAWMAVSVIGFYTAMTIFGVPHASLGADIFLPTQSPSHFKSKPGNYLWRQHFVFVVLRLLIEQFPARHTHYTSRYTFAG